MRKPVSLRTAAIAAVMVAGAGAWSARAFRRPLALDVATTAVTRGPIVRPIVASGSLQAVTTVQVGTQVSGTIAALGADFNAIVHAGQVVARLDPALAEAALSDAQARVRGAEAASLQAEAAARERAAAAEDARQKLTRAEDLAARELIPRSDLDAARIAMDEASADVKSAGAGVALARSAIAEAEAAAEQAKVALAHTVITSPIDGIVINRNVDVGQTVAASVQAPVLFTIAADVRRLQVEVDVDESDVAGIEAGERATFAVESYANEMFEGRVAMVRLQPVARDPSVAVVSYAVMIDVSNPDERLRPGMTATVSLDGARVASSVRIPNAALSFRPSADALAAAGQTFADVPVADAADPTRRLVWEYRDGQFVGIPVQVGLADRAWTALLHGPLDAGDALVTATRFGPRQ